MHSNIQIYETELDKILFKIKLIRKRFNLKLNVNYHNRNVVYWKQIYWYLVPAQEGERPEITVPTTQSTSCIQYVDEGGGTNAFSTANSHM